MQELCIILLISQPFHQIVTTSHIYEPPSQTQTQLSSATPTYSRNYIYGKTNFGLHPQSRFFGCYARSLAGIYSSVCRNKSRKKRRYHYVVKRSACLLRLLVSRPVELLAFSDNVTANDRRHSLPSCPYPNVLSSLPI